MTGRTWGTLTLRETPPSTSSLTPASPPFSQPSRTASPPPTTPTPSPPIPGRPLCSPPTDRLPPPTRESPPCSATPPPPTPPSPSTPARLKAWPTTQTPHRQGTGCSRMEITADNHPPLPRIQGFYHLMYHIHVSFAVNPLDAQFHCQGELRQPWLQLLTAVATKTPGTPCLLID